MKKLVFTLIAAIAFCGSIFAQSYQTHWPEFNHYDYEQWTTLVAANVKIDNNYIGGNDNWATLEVGTFVNGVIRGHAFMNYFPDYDPYPIVESLGVYYDQEEYDLLQPVTFKLYDHSTGYEYDMFTCSLNIKTGISDYGSYDEPVVISFFHTFTKEIDPYTTDGGWYFISSPIGEVNANEVLGLRTSDFDFYSFDQTANLEWINHRDEEDYTLQRGVGYLYANSTGENLTFVGAPYVGIGEVTLSKDDNAEFPGWNLVGNPFAQTAYIDKPFYTINGTGSEVVAVEGNEVGAMEGVFVVASEDGETMTFSTEPIQSKSQIVLNVSKDDRGNTIDRAIVRFGQESMLPKFMLNESHTKMYISKDDHDYAVVRSSRSGKLPVSFQPAEDGTYKINVNAENVNLKYLHLVDKLTGADVDLLRTPNYSFEAKTADDAGRFILVFKAAINPFQLMAVKDDTKGFGFFSNGEWTINNEGDALLQVIDVNGQILINEEINGSVTKHINAALGVYILRLVNGKDEKTQKIVIE